MSVLRQRFDTPNVAEIIEATAAVTGISRERLLGRRRFKPVSNARKIVYFLGVRLGHSTTHIGARLWRDHTSVVHGRRAAEILIERDPGFARRVDLVEKHAARLATVRRARVAASVPLELRGAA